MALYMIPLRVGVDAQMYLTAEIFENLLSLQGFLKYGEFEGKI